MRFIISVPRSGSHLFAQMTNSKMVVLFEKNQPGPIEQIKDNATILKTLDGLKRNQNYWTHLPHHFVYEKFISRCDSAILLLRDPRDVIVSHAFIVEKRPDISMNYLIGKRRLSDFTFSERIDFLIETMRPFLYLFDRWRTCKVDIFHYEEYIQNPILVYERLSELGYGSVDDIQSRSAFKHPDYFRKGKTGDWEKYFTDKQKERVVQTLGGLIESWKT